MTVEALLKQLKDERMDAMTNVWIYGGRTQDAMCHGDVNLANMYRRLHNECYEKAERLSMIIKEIEKRVSK